MKLQLWQGIQQLGELVGRVEGAKQVFDHQPRSQDFTVPPQFAPGLESQIQGLHPQAGHALDFIENIVGRMMHRAD